MRKQQPFAFSAIFLLALILFPLSVNAKSSCYSQEELDAEQAIRLHSELMVVSLSCRTASNGQSLLEGYKHFTQANLNYIKSAEKTLLAHYRKAGASERALDRLRTDFGNEYSQQLANQTPSVFCGKLRDRAFTNSYYSPGQIQDEVKRLAAAYGGRQQLCAQTVRADASEAKQQ